MERQLESVVIPIKSEALRLGNREEKILLKLQRRDKSVKRVSSYPKKMTNDSDTESTDSMPSLSLATLALLQSFKEQKPLQEDLKTMKSFSENWQLSQFWYTEETAWLIAREAISQTVDGGYE